MSDAYGGPPGPPPPPPYGQPYAGSRYLAPRQSQDAVIALILAIGGWFVCPVVLSVPALVYAGRARRAITASAGALAGSGLATAATVIAWLSIVAYSLAALFLLGFVVSVNQ